MRNFHSIIVALKEYLALTQDTKIYDKDVAKVLGLSQAHFATIKKRDSIPYAHILIFCKKEQLCCNEFFFEAVT